MFYKNEHRILPDAKCAYFKISKHQWLQGAFELDCVYTIFVLNSEANYILILLKRKEII